MGRVRCPRFEQDRTRAMSLRSKRDRWQSTRYCTISIVTCKRISHGDLLVSKRLFSPCPPLRDDQHHARTDTSFECAEDESKDDQSGEAGERCTDHARNRPAEEAEHDPIIDGELDKCVDGHWNISSIPTISADIVIRSTHMAGRSTGRNRQWTRAMSTRFLSNRCPHVIRNWPRTRHSTCRVVDRSKCRNRPA